MSLLTYPQSLNRVLEKIFHPRSSDMDGELARLQQMHDECQECPGDMQPMESHNLHIPNRNSRNLRVVGLLSSRGICSARKQAATIEQYCRQFGYSLVEVFDCASESTPLAIHEALEALRHVDGLIVSEIFSLVEHDGDTLRDLAPMIHDHFFHKGKHLISVKEQINTGTPEGQEAIIEYLKQLTDVSHRTC